MHAIARMTPHWTLLGSLEGWRRTTGVLQAHLAAAPLLTFAHPGDWRGLWAVAEMSTAAPAAAVARIGYVGRRLRAHVEVTPGAAGERIVTVSALEERPVSSWWVPAAEYAAYPATPSRPAVVA